MAARAENVTSASDPVMKAQPALSATSDAPVVAAPEPVKEEGADKTVAEPTEGQEHGKEADGADKTGDETLEADKTEGGKKDETPAWMKREITKHRNREREAKAERDAALARANALDGNLKKALEAIEKLTGDSAARAIKDADKADPRPQRDKFNSPEEYDSALIEWSGRRAVQVAKAEMEAEEAKKATEAEEGKKKADLEKRLAEEAETYSKNKEKFMKTHPDYEDVAEADDLKVSLPMANFIRNDDDGPAVAYYLGQNPEEAARIAEMASPVHQVAALGRIAQRLATPAARKVEKPAPINPLKTGNAPASTTKDPNDESMEEYAARRNAEMRAARSNGHITTH